MRINRSHLLWPEAGSVHLYWRCHNKEFYLDTPKMKALYLNSIRDGMKYKRTQEFCWISAFCVMGNHFHQLAHYQSGSSHLSNFMRYSHGLFGQRYNRIKNRTGQVADGRPKTPLIQNEKHQIRVHFYIEANPIRAGICKLSNLKNFIFCSYGFYAYGRRSPFSHLLKIPDWYLKLGNTMQERQQRYRKLFSQYIESGSSKSSLEFKSAYIGEQKWIALSKERLKQFLKLHFKKSTPYNENTEQNSS